MKKFGKILAMVMVALMMMSTAAFADAAIGDPAIKDEVVTVTLTGLTAGEEATILVVNEGVALASLENTDIVYIDQITADDGTATFTLDASAAIAREDGSKYVDIYCGYTNMATTAPVSKTAVQIKDAEVTIKYGDVDGNGTIGLNDASEALMIYTGTIAEPTEAQMKAANVNGVSGIQLDDASLILQYFTGTITKFPVEE